MKDKENQTQDLIIIGGGIMGLMTAYYASALVKNVTILEKKTINENNKEASSFSFTRSLHADYLDPQYVTLAYEALVLWKELQTKTKKEIFIACGSLNIAKESTTPDLSTTYAEKSFQTRTSLQFPTEKFDKKLLQKRFPQFNADFGSFDPKTGLLKLRTITALLLKLLHEKNVTLVQNVEINSIQETNQNTIITTADKKYTTKKVVITAGRWINDVLDTIEKNKLRFPITTDKPKESKYFYPPKKIVDQFFPEKFPVFAYLDIGIYGHPIFDKKRNAMKIGYYSPPDMKQKKTNINSITDFVNECLPLLKNVPNEIVKDADQCMYDLVKDDDFIIGKLPQFNHVVVGGGWRGTGYKFAPVIGKILSQLALQNTTAYNIARFSPERFVKK